MMIGAVAGTLVSVNVGLPRDIQWNGKTVHTGIWKTVVDGPVRVRRLNVDGDGQGDTEGHGGENRAVFVYQLDSYRHWQDFLHRNDFEAGQFGENLTVEGLADSDVCIGDRFRIGTAEFEISQPRVTCYRVGIRLDQPDMAQLLVAHHRPGFYFRVIAEGTVEAGDPIVKIGDGRHRLSVADVDALLYLPHRNLAQLRDALDNPALSPGWQGSFRDLLPENASQVVGATTSGWTGFRGLRVISVSDESPYIRSITLDDPGGSALPAGVAGQYLTLRIPAGAEQAVVRNYSLSSPPGAPHYRISVKREQHGIASQWLHHHVSVGDVVDVAAPRGDFVLTSAAETPVVLVSAGVGATPVLAMLAALVAAQRARAVWWFHAARSRAELAFAREVEGLIAVLPDAQCVIRYSEDAASDRTGGGKHLSVSDFEAARIPSDSDAYLCGPQQFMADMTTALLAVGLTSDHIHTELFGGRPAINPGVTNATLTSPHPPSGRTGDGPIVTFARSAVAVPFDSRYRSLLELAEACDVPTRWSCRTGVCHTCVTPLITGSVSYQPQPLELPSPTEALICCSVPEGPVVLDL